MSVSIASRGPAVVVCCATGQGGHLQPALDVLEARGYDITLIDGAEVGDRGLSERVRRHDQSATYVIAMSPELDGPCATRLMKVLRSGAVPPDRIVLVAVNWREPMVLLQALDEAPAFRRTTPTSKEGEAKAPTLSKRRPSRIGRSREPTGPHARVAIRPDRRPLELPTGPVLPPTPETTIQHDKARAAPKPQEHGATTHLEPTADLDPPSGPARPRLSPVPPEPSPATASPAPANSTSRSEVDRPMSPRAEETIGPSGVPSTILSRISSPIMRRSHRLTGPLRPLVTDVGSWMSHTANRLVRSRARWAIAGGSVVAVGLVIAWTLRDKTPSSRNGAQPAVAAIQKFHDGPIEAPPLGDAAVSPREALAEAQARGEVGRSGAIAFTPLDPPKQAFAEALSTCEQTRVAGLGGWRLPTLSELHDLAVERTIPWDPYWSGTEMDGFGKQALIWNEKKSRAAPIGKKWRGARAICVRDIEAPTDPK